MSLLSSLPILSRHRRSGAPPADGWRLLGLGALTATLLALAGAHAGPASAAARLAAPRQASPAADAVVEAMPSFAWKRVRSAARYEFQLSADSAFKSIVLGQGNGSYQTPNTAASIDEDRGRRLLLLARAGDHREGPRRPLVLGAQPGEALDGRART